MKGNRFKLLKADITIELDNLNRLLNELSEGLNYFGGHHSYIELRAIGSILHDFYCGVEKIFKRIAITLDGEIASGDDWHYRLISRMGLEIEGIRPKIISNDLQSELKEYLRFRHVFRNVYGFVLKWEKMQPLVEELPHILNKFNQELNSFFNFLDEMSENTNN